MEAGGERELKTMRLRLRQGRSPDVHSTSCAWTAATKATAGIVEGGAVVFKREGDWRIQIAGFTPTPLEASEAEQFWGEIWSGGGRLRVYAPTF
jgi:hypothetical protein